MLKCRDLKNLPSLKSIEYVAGEDGIDIIRCSYVTETKTFSNWVHGQELLIISGITQTEGYDLLSLIKEGINNKMAGALYKNKVYYYDKLGLYKLFMEIDKEEVLEKYYDDLLGTLMEYDKKNETYLVETLKNYLEQNCNIIQTSKVMFVHRNTLKYRIQRIEEITNKSLSDSYTRLEFQNALLIKNIIQ